MQGPQGNATSASWAAMLPALRFGSWSSVNLLLKITFWDAELMPLNSFASRSYNILLKRQRECRNANNKQTIRTPVQSSQTHPILWETQLLLSARFWPPWVPSSARGSRRHPSVRSSARGLKLLKPPGSAGLHMTARLPPQRTGRRIRPQFPGFPRRVASWKGCRAH